MIDVQARMTIPGRPTEAVDVESFDLFDATGVRDDKLRITMPEVRVDMLALTRLTFIINQSDFGTWYLDSYDIDIETNTTSATFIKQFFAEAVAAQVINLLRNTPAFPSHSDFSLQRRWEAILGDEVQLGPSISYVMQKGTEPSYQEVQQYLNEWGLTIVIGQSKYGTLSFVQDGERYSIVPIDYYSEPVQTLDIDELRPLQENIADISDFRGGAFNRHMAFSTFQDPREVTYYDDADPYLTVDQSLQRFYEGGDRNSRIVYLGEQPNQYFGTIVMEAERVRRNYLSERLGCAILDPSLGLRVRQGVRIPTHPYRTDWLIEELTHTLIGSTFVTNLTLAPRGGASVGDRIVPVDELVFSNSPTGFDVKDGFPTQSDCPEPPTITTIRTPSQIPDQEGKDRVDGLWKASESSLHFAIGYSGQHEPREYRVKLTSGDSVLELANVPYRYDGQVVSVWNILDGQDYSLEVSALTANTQTCDVAAATVPFTGGTAQQTLELWTTSAVSARGLDPSGYNRSGRNALMDIVQNGASNSAQINLGPVLASTPGAGLSLPPIPTTDIRGLQVFHTIFVDGQGSEAEVPEIYVRERTFLGAGGTPEYGDWSSFELTQEGVDRTGVIVELSETEGTVAFMVFLTYVEAGKEYQYRLRPPGGGIDRHSEVLRGFDFVLQRDWSIFPPRFGEDATYPSFRQRQVDRGVILPRPSDRTFNPNLPAPPYSDGR